MSDGVNPEIIKKTQKVLGKYIKKPLLTDKLLSKPPFRFLHDVVMGVIKNTGFLKGLFSQDEQIPENVKDREAKLAFLNKLIDAVKFVTNIDLKVKASKIVAGVQVNETNLLLQAIAYGVENKLDISEYLKLKKNAQNNIKNEHKNRNITHKETKRSPQEEKTTEQKSKEIRSKSKVREQSRDKKTVKDKKEKSIHSNRSTKQDARTKKLDSNKGSKDIVSPPSISNTSDNTLIEGKYSEDADKPVSAVPHDEINDIQSSKDFVGDGADNIDEVKSSLDERPKTRDVENGYLSKLSKEDQDSISRDNNNAVTDNAAEVFVIESNEIDTPVIRQTSIRPKSARPKSGEFKEKPQKTEEDTKRISNKPESVENNIVLQRNFTQRPKSSLRPPSVRPSSARPGAPRLRPDSAFPVEEVIPMGKINVIVENFDNDVEDEETIVIHNAPEEILSVESNMDVPAKNQSHLVEQILDQIKETQDSLGTRKEPEWEQDSIGGRDTTSKEMNELRNLIQCFTKSANPLGKLLNYLHEDIETMQAELQQWTKLKTSLFTEIAKQEKIKSDMEKPLLEKLENLKQEIVKQEQEIIDIRSNIIKNDLRIKDLIVK